MADKLHPNQYFNEFIQISINQILKELENKNVLTKTDSDNIINRILDKKPRLDEVDWNA